MSLLFSIILKTAIWPLYIYCWYLQLLVIMFHGCFSLKLHITSYARTCKKQTALVAFTL